MAANLELLDAHIDWCNAVTDALRDHGPGAALDAIDAVPVENHRVLLLVLLYARVDDYTHVEELVSNAAALIATMN